MTLIIYKTPSSKINCDIHTDVQIDYFCSLSESHRSCETVLPLDSASKDVKVQQDRRQTHRRCHSVHSVHSFTAQSEQYFSATSLLFFSEHGSQIVSMMDLQDFCCQHDAVCCRACLAGSHRSCESALPLDFASKDVKNSSLLSDTLEEQDYMTETLSKMSENRDEHHVDNRNNPSGRLCVFHSLF
jgi:hypothetical protein